MAVSPVEAPPGAPAAGRAGTAERLTARYLASISSANAATLAATPGFYGERVRFHGRTLSTAALVAEKRRFFRRWPQRRYEPREGGLRTVCEPAGATCIVRAVLGFRAWSPGRGARAQGLSELVLTVSFAGERPVIVSESSRVLRRGAAALSSIPRTDPRFAEDNDARSGAREAPRARPGSPPA